MTKKEFDRFVESKSQEPIPKVIDWEKTKQEWLNSLNYFYSLIDQWLLEYTKSGKIETQDCNIHLEEENIGKYIAKMRTIKIGPEVAILRPIGTLLIGARGRVDLEGKNGTIKFILTGKNSNGFRISIKIADATEDKNDPKIIKKLESEEEWVWKIATPPPNVKFIELDQNTFFESLTEVLNV